MSYFNNIGVSVPSIGRQAWVGPVVALSVAEHTRLCGTQFGSAVDTNFWTTSNSGTSSASSVAAGICTMTSGTSNNGYGHIRTVSPARFIFAHPNYYRGAARVTATSVTNCTRRWGAFTPGANPYNTPTDGFGFELSSTGVLSCNTWSGGTVANTVNSGSFNGDVSSWTADTNVHAFEIVYFVMGAWFYVDGVFVHKFLPTTAILNQAFNHPCAATVFNSAGGSTSGTMELWAATILRLGKELTVPKYGRITTAATTTFKSSPGTLRSITLGNPGGTLITIYDNTSGSGSKIAVINTPATANPVTLTFNSPFYTGLTVVSTGTWDATIEYE